MPRGGGRTDSYRVPCGRPRYGGARGAGCETHPYRSCHFRVYNLNPFTLFFPGCGSLPPPAFRRGSGRPESECGVLPGSARADAISVRSDAGRRPRSPHGGVRRLRIRAYAGSRVPRAVSPPAGRCNRDVAPTVSVTAVPAAIHIRPSPVSAAARVSAKQQRSGRCEVAMRRIRSARFTTALIDPILDAHRDAGLLVDGSRC